MAEHDDPEFQPSQPTDAKSAASEAAAEGLPGADQPRLKGRWQPPTPEELQKSFTQYRIDALLGRGGMGAVYKGWQKSLARPVAIKILPLEVEEGEPQFAARFKYEAQAMARLSHPAICPVYDAGETARGLLYFVMEYVECGDLGQRIAVKGPLAPREAVAIAGTVCDALQFAHERGIIHRDIKPTNVLLNLHGQWKVADFGLAKVVAESSITKTDASLGSAGFISPEAIVGAGSVDHRADIYAVGAMLFQMLTGCLPVGAFEKPSVLVPGLDPRFDEVVAKAMRRDREQRYASAQELRIELVRILAIKPGRGPALAAVADAPPARLAPPARRSPSVWIAGAVLLVLAAGGAWWWMQKRSAADVGAESLDVVVGGAGIQKSVTKGAADDLRRRWRPVPSKLNAPIDRGAVHLQNLDVWSAPKFRIADVGIRATVVWQPSPPGRNELIKVTARLKDAEHYYACLHGPVVELGYYRPPSMRALQRWSVEPPPAPGEAISLQLACVGQRLAVWVRDRLVGTMDDDTLNDAANIGIQAEDGHILRLEYLDLDGLSDDEAFRLLGLDASGSKALIPAEALAFGDSRYLFVPGKLSWAESKVMAEELGGHLATLTTKEEAEWAKKTFLTQEFTCLWIGGQRAPDGQWVWITGEPWSHADWARHKDGRREPINPNPDFERSENNLELAWHGLYVPPGGWNDADSSSAPDPRYLKTGALVEWDPRRRRAPAK